jgi:hypothetical protein
MICRSLFTPSNDRHHCRQCGKCICDSCIPEAATKIKLKWCFQCFGTTDTDREEKHLDANTDGHDDTSPILPHEELESVEDEIGESQTVQDTVNREAHLQDGTSTEPDADAVDNEDIDDEVCASSQGSSQLCRDTHDDTGNGGQVEDTMRDVYDFADVVDYLKDRAEELDQPTRDEDELIVESNSTDFKVSDFDKSSFAFDDVELIDRAEDEWHHQDEKDSLVSEKVIPEEKSDEFTGVPQTYKSAEGIISSSQKIVFMDFNSGWIYGGVVGTAAPMSVPCLKGSSKLQSYLMSAKVTYGHEARESRHYSQYSCPIKRGKIENWDDLEDVLLNAIDKSFPSPDSIMIADSPVWTLEDRRKLTQMVFESINSVSSFGLVSQGTICSFASGLENLTHPFFDTISGCFMPMLESFPMKLSVLDIAETDPLKLVREQLFSAFVKKCSSFYDDSIQGSLLENAVVLESVDYSSNRTTRGVIPMEVKRIMGNGGIESYSYWHGVSSFINQGRLRDKLILLEEYDECGPNIVNRKCL